MPPNRDITVDTLRGLAIVTMVGANMAASVAAQPHPFGLRVYGSFAAPLFILISAMMVFLTTQTKGYKLTYFLLRGALILMVGVLVDVLIWNVYPFMDYDVLYLIGFSVPLAFLYLQLGRPFQWVAIVLIFLLTPFLQKILGYTEYVNLISLWGEPIEPVLVKTQTGVFNHWIVDGWFPLFPWLGFSFLGVKLATRRWKHGTFNTFQQGSVLLWGLGILTFGSAIWYFCPGNLLTRGESIELFYPPSLGYIITTIGLILTLFFILDWKRSLFIYKPLKVLGESPLFMYVIHIPLIEYVISPIWSKQNSQTFLFIYVGFLIFLILLAYGLRILKSNWKHRPYIVRFLLGS